MNCDKNYDNLKASDSNEDNRVKKQKKRKKFKGKFAPEYILTPLPKSEI